MAIKIYNPQVGLNTPNVPERRAPTPVRQSFGEDVYQANAELGNTAFKISSELQNHLIEKKRQEDEAKAADLDTNFRVNLQDKMLNNTMETVKEGNIEVQRPKGLLSRQLGQAKGISKEYDEWYQKLRQNYIMNAPSAEQAGKIGQKLDSYYLTARDNIIEHEAKQGNLYNAKRVQSNIEQQVANAYLFTDTDKALDGALDNVVASQSELNRINGLDDVSANLENNKTKFSFLKSAIQSGLVKDKTGDLSRAILEHVKPSIDPVQYDALNKEIETHMKAVSKETEEGLYEKFTDGNLSLEEIDAASMPVENGGIGTKKAITLKNKLITAQNVTIKEITENDEAAESYIETVNAVIDNKVDLYNARQLLVDMRADGVIDDKEMKHLDSIKKNIADQKWSVRSDVWANSVNTIKSWFGQNNPSQTELAVSLKKLISSTNNNPQETANEIIKQNAIKNNPSLGLSPDPVKQIQEQEQEKIKQKNKDNLSFNFDSINPFKVEEAQASEIGVSPTGKEYQSVNWKTEYNKLSLGEKILSGAIGNKIVDIVSGGMSLKEADDYAKATLQSASEIPQDIFNTSKMIFRMLKGDIDRNAEFFTNPITAINNLLNGKSTKKLYDELASHPEEKQAALKLIGRVFTPIGRVIEGTVATVGAGIDRESVADILSSGVKGFLKPEEVDSLTSRIPMNEWERSGNGIVRLIPRAVAEAIETYAIAELTLGLPSKVEGLAQRIQDIKISKARAEITDVFEKARNEPQFRQDFTEWLANRGGYDKNVIGGDLNRIVDDTLYVLEIKAQQDTNFVNKLAENKSAFSLRDKLRSEAGELKFNPIPKSQEAGSVISYVNKNGEKIFTKLSIAELKVLQDEVKNIPTPPKGENQIHLDAKTSNLNQLGKEVTRGEFLAGHSQAEEVLRNANAQNDLLNPFAEGLKLKIEQGLSKEDFIALYDKGMKAQNLTTRDTAKNVDKLIKQSGLTPEEYYDKIQQEVSNAEGVGGQAQEGGVSQGVEGETTSGVYLRDNEADRVATQTGDEIKLLEFKPYIKGEGFIGLTNKQSNSMVKMIKSLPENINAESAKKIMGEIESKLSKNLNPSQIKGVIREQTGQTSESKILLNYLKEKYADQINKGKLEQEIEDKLAVPLKPADVKSIVRESTGQNPEKEKVYTERQAIRIALKREAQAAANEKSITRERLQAIKDIIKTSLPVAERGKFINLLANATNPKEVVKGIMRVDNAVESYQRKELVGDIKKSLKKIGQSKNIAIDYIEKIQELGDQIDFVDRRMETIASLNETQKFINQRRAEGQDVSIPQYMINKLRILSQKPVETISSAELTDLLNQINQLRDLGTTKLRTRQEVEEYMKERDLQDISKDSKKIEYGKEVKRVAGEPVSLPQDLKNTYENKRNDLRALNLNILPMDVVFDILDNNKNYEGSNYRIFKKRVDTAYSAYLEMRSEFQQDIVQLAKELNLNYQDFELMGIYAAREQEGGYDKLLDSGLTEQQIESVNLNENQTKLYRAMRRKLDLMRPYIAEVMNTVYNQPLSTVRNYFPFMTDFEAMSDQEVKDLYGDNVQEVGQKMRKNVEKGFTIERTLGQQKIRLNAMDIYMKHIDNASYLVKMGRDIKYLGDIAQTEEYQESVGDLGQKIVKDWVDILARKGSSGEKRIPALDTLRKNVGVATLGFKLSSALIQPTALMDGAALIGTDAFGGFNDVVLHRKAREFVFNNMPEVKERIGDDPAYLDYEGNGFGEKIGKASMQPLRFLDSLTASGVAMGAYKQYLKENNIPLDLENPNQNAINFAQRIVRRTQSTGMFKDVPSIFLRGDALSGNVSLNKAILQFQSFMLNRWSLIQHDFATLGLKEKDIAKAMTIAFFLMMANFAEIGFRRIAKDTVDFLTDGDIDEDKEEKSLLEQVVLNMLQNVPFVSQAIGMTEYGSMPVPTISAIDRATETLQAYKKSKKEETKNKNLMRLLTNITGLAGVPGSVQADQIIKENAKKDKKKSTNMATY